MALGRGDTRDNIEARWENAATIKKRLALALQLDDSADISKWVSGGSARAATMAVVTKGAHDGVADFKLAVNQARLATGDLAKAAQ